VSRPVATIFRGLALAPLLAAALAAGCGGEEKGAPLPRAQAASIVSNLDEIRRRMEAENACGDIVEEDYPAIEAELARLPEDVDPDLRRALKDSVKRLRELTDEECQRIKEEKKAARPDPEPVPEPVPVPEPEPVPTTPTEPEETVPEDTVPEPEPEPEPEPRPEPQPEPPKQPKPPKVTPQPGGNVDPNAADAGGSEPGRSAP